MRRIRTIEEVGPIPPKLTVVPESPPDGIRLVSVDDHVIEPPGIFESRFPRHLAERAPYVLEEDDGAHVWIIDGQREPQMALSAVAGLPREKWTRDPSRFDEIRPGCWRIKDRLGDMDAAGVSASLCFPSAVIGFGGSRPLRVADPEVAWGMFRADNEWYYEEWWGQAPERIVLLQIPWMKDAEIAAREIRANAAKGFRAVTFSEDPARHGLPSIWTGYWDPFLRACEETSTAVCLHVGSGGRHPTLAADAPPPMSPVQFPAVSLMTATDWLWSGVLTRFPELKIVMSEGGVAWVPALAHRSDYVLQHSLGGTDRHVWADSLLPSEVLHRNFWFCALDEPLGPELVATVGVDRILAEMDYPHADGTWPNTQRVFEDRLGWMPTNDREAVCHGNAEEVFGMDTSNEPGEAG